MKKHRLMMLITSLVLSGSAWAQLLVDVVPAEHDFNVGDRHAKLLGQETNHVIGRPPRDRRLGHADIELIALDLADGILARARFPEHIENQRFAVPGAERINGGSFASALVAGACVGFRMGLTYVLNCDDVVDSHITEFPSLPDLTNSRV